MLDTIKDIAKYPLRMPSAFVEAIKKAREDQDSSLLDKIGVFFSAFTDAMGGIDKEREDVAKGTEAAVQGSIIRTLKHPTSYLNLKRSPGQPTTTTQQVDKTLAVATRGFGQLDRASRAHAHRAIKNFEEKLQGNSVYLNYDEVTCLGATATAVLLELKHQYPNPADFKKALDGYLKASEGSNFPLKKMMKLSTLSIFSLKTADLISVARKFGLTAWDAPKIIVDILPALKNPKKNKSMLAQFFKKHILRNTDSGNIEKVIVLMDKIKKSPGKTLTTQDITDLVFLIDDRDFKRLISVLTNNRS